MMGSKLILLEEKGKVIGRNLGILWKTRTTDRKDKEAARLEAGVQISGFSLCL